MRHFRSAVAQLLRTGSGGGDHLVLRVLSLKETGAS